MLLVGLTVYLMTTVTQLPVHREGRVPADTFPIRLAIVRAEQGWNYDQAAAATGIGSETWRLWEKRKRHCTTLEVTCRKIAAATGFSYEWLMVGGTLADPTPPRDGGHGQADTPAINTDYSPYSLTLICDAA